jgi:hypothetical protein
VLSGAQPHAHNLDDALSGLRYLKALVAIGAKHKLAGGPLQTISSAALSTSWPAAADAVCLDMLHSLG